MKRDKASADPRGGHVRLYWEVIDSPEWSSITATDQRAYVALRRALGRTNNGDLSLPLSRAKHYRVTSPATLAKALRALVAVGLIAVTRRGGCTHGGQRLATLYRFTDEKVYPMPAKLIDQFKETNEWKDVKSIAHGKALIKTAESNAREIAQKKRLLHFPNATATDDEVVEPLTPTAIESWRPRPIRKLKQSQEAPIERGPSDGAGLRVVGQNQRQPAPCFKK